MSSEFDLSTDLASIQARLNSAFDGIHKILEPSQCAVPSLEQQLKEQTQQLKEQTQQIKQMAEMMKSMMSLAMPLLEEKANKLRKEKEEARKQAERVRIQKEEDRKYAEQIRKREEINRKKSIKKPLRDSGPDWSCPNDGRVYRWTYKGTQYLRNSDNQVWLEEADGSCGDWCGVYLIDKDCIDYNVEEPDFE